MDMNLYVINDRKAEEARSIFWAPTDVHAQRAFAAALKDPRSAESDFVLYPEDFELIMVGSIEKRTGKLFPVDIVKIVCSANSLIANPPKEPGK